MTNFVREAAGLGGSIWTHSVYRSVRGLHGPVELLSVRHDHAGGLLQCWWGPLVPIERGDVIRYFTSPAGIAIEAVEKPS
jgi:hypothetical protein